MYGKGDERMYQSEASHNVRWAYGDASVRLLVAPAPILRDLRPRVATSQRKTIKDVKSSTLARIIYKYIIIRKSTKPSNPESPMLGCARATMVLTHDRGPIASMEGW